MCPQATYSPVLPMGFPHAKFDIQESFCAAPNSPRSKPHAKVAAFHAQGMPNVSARHQMDELTPTKSLPDDGLTGPQRRTLLRLSAAKQPAALRDASDWLIVAGDNGAESEFSRSKQQMRRQSLLGRSAPATVHMDALASIRLLEHPGLLPLMQAFRLYREARRHELAHPSSEFLDPVKDRSWLFR